MGGDPRRSSAARGGKLAGVTRSRGSGHRFELGKDRERERKVDFSPRWSRDVWEGRRTVAAERRVGARCARPRRRFGDSLAPIGDDEDSGDP